ncbi:MAG: YbjN domain-containing protein [Alphaproteobacteria bacterium]|nr:YbjN domain-containing protein [Alphaproteobacteria bacterium]MCL2505556.1 YbjN domain-containing protein [Alphaproteobacteria bacterium]
MSFQIVSSQASLPNPLDILEEIISANEWLFDRTNDDELIVELDGRWCHYRMFFVWQKEIGALQFSCQFDVKVPDRKREDVHDLLAMLNDKMWLGHFNVDMQQKTPLFRYTLLANGNRTLAIEALEDLIEIALTECERFYPAFQLVIWGGKRPGEALASSMIDVAGCA